MVLSFMDNVKNDSYYAQKAIENIIIIQDYISKELQRIHE